MESPQANTGQPRELRVLEANIAAAQKVISGSYRAAGDSAFDTLQKNFAQAREKGVDVSSIQIEAEKMLKELPTKDINNFFNTAEEFLEKGDLGAAKLWHANIDARINAWEQRGVLDTQTLEEFRTRSREMQSKLYA